MNITRRALFELCQKSNSLDVMDVDGLACDNAAATIGSRFVRGNFDEEFLTHWFGTLQGILSGGDNVTPAAREFFEAHGVPY